MGILPAYALPLIAYEASHYLTLEWLKVANRNPYFRFFFFS